MRTLVAAALTAAVVGAGAAGCTAKPAITVPAPPPASAEATPTAQAPDKPAKDYPASKRDSVVDTIHGTQVADPYRWLEDATKPDVQQWMTAEDDYARSRLAKLPRRDDIAKALSAASYYDAVQPPQHRKDRYFVARKHKDKEKRVVYWRVGETGPDKLLLDPNTWSQDGSTGLHGWEPSWDGKYVAYAVSEHNADETTLKVIDVANGKVLVDTLPNTRFSSTSWTPDNRAFYYTYTPPAPDPSKEAERTAHAEVRLHRLGTDAAKDEVIYPATGHADWFPNAAVTPDGHYLIVHIEHGSSGDTAWYYKDLRANPKDWTTLDTATTTHATVEYFRDRFYVRTDDGAPRFHVFTVDPKTPARTAWKEIVAETDATLEDIYLRGGMLALVYLRNAASEVEIHALDGKLVRKLDVPPLGTVGTIEGDPDDDAAYVGYSSFTEPGIVYKTSIKSGKVSEWARAKLDLDTSKLATEQVRYKSKDGTEVTMFVVHRQDVVKTGKVPTLLTGYGGFRIPSTPEYKPPYAAWVELGGVLAIANLRGGSEYGEDWHRSGMLANKQNVFDDFIGAAKYLLDSGWTSRDKLAIHGRSNGGLLMGAAITQAPELFKAVLCWVPLEDMVRYPKFGDGMAWVSEYGSPDEPAQFKALHAYSPYHRVKDGATYPAMLMMSSDHDDRVDPMHARKLVAAMQAAQAGTAPIWLRIERNAGHAGADVVKQQVEQWTDAIAFVLAQFGE